MKVLILEDERLSAERLQELLRQARPDWQVLDILESLEAALEWWQVNLPPDLIFVDIHLADGSSFDFIRKKDVRVPLIFTTAYDRHALEAFQVNSIDYLLKPISIQDLNRSLTKFSQWNTPAPVSFDLDNLEVTLKKLSPPYKQRFLVRFGDHLLYRATNDTAYFYAEDKTVFMVGMDTKRYIVDYRLEQLDGLLNPAHFFRLNRKFIVHISAIQRMKSTLNGRVQMYLTPPTNGDVYVSKDRVPDLKAWLDY